MNASSRSPPPEPEFRMRGKEVSRLESFSDAVFAFAVTLLVLSLEVPTNFEHLVRMLKGTWIFAVCFTLLVQVWVHHHAFFRRYALDDPWTRVLNFFLLFVVLVYVYPLKFLWVAVQGTNTAGMSGEDFRWLFTIYGAGTIGVYGTLALMHLHALRKAVELELTEIERFDTRWTAFSPTIVAGVAAISIVTAWAAPVKVVGFAGFAYFLIGPAMWMHGSRFGAGRRVLWERICADESAAARASSPTDTNAVRSVVE